MTPSTQPTINPAPSCTVTGCEPITSPEPVPPPPLPPASPSWAGVVEEKGSWPPSPFSAPLMTLFVVRVVRGAAEAACGRVVVRRVVARRRWMRERNVGGGGIVDGSVHGDGVILGGGLQFGATQILFGRRRAVEAGVCGLAPESRRPARGTKFAAITAGIHRENLSSNAQRSGHGLGNAKPLKTVNAVHTTSPPGHPRRARRQSSRVATRRCPRFEVSLASQMFQRAHQKLELAWSGFFFSSL